MIQGSWILDPGSRVQGPGSRTLDVNSQPQLALMQQYIPLCRILVDVKGPQDIPHKKGIVLRAQNDTRTEI